MSFGGLVPSYSGGWPDCGNPPARPFPEDRHRDCSGPLAALVPLMPQLVMRDLRAICRGGWAKKN